MSVIVDCDFHSLLILLPCNLETFVGRVVQSLQGRVTDIRRRVLLYVLMWSWFPYSVFIVLHSLVYPQAFRIFHEYHLPRVVTHETAQKAWILGWVIDTRSVAASRRWDRCFKDAWGVLRECLNVLRGRFKVPDPMGNSPGNHSKS